MRVSTEIVFVRHGETDGNQSGLFQGHGNSHLSANGRLQVQAAAEELKEEPFTHAVSSDLIRAVETAEGILKFHPGIRLETTPDLEEWTFGPNLEGRLQSELMTEMPELMDKFRREQGDFDVEGGESRPQFQARISRCLDRIIEENRGGCILLVSHGWAAHRILAHLYGPPAAGMMFPVPYNTGISRFRYFNDEHTCQMLCWNSTAHLKGLPVHHNPVDR